VPDDALGATDRVLYVTAAMAGLRQGELLALRWEDVDWTAGLLRIRRSYSRGRLGTPKTRRGNRAVPMADRVAADLERRAKAGRNDVCGNLCGLSHDRGRGRHERP